MGVWGAGVLPSPSMLPYGRCSVSGIWTRGSDRKGAVLRIMIVGDSE
jgi:hypothetical protein